MVTIPGRPQYHQLLLLCCFWLWTTVPITAEQQQQEAIIQGTIAFTTHGRMHYDFDVYTVSLPSQFLSLGNGSSYLQQQRRLQETRMTYGQSVNYNAQLVSSSLASVPLLKTLHAHGFRNLLETEKEEEQEQDAPQLLLYVSEMEGSPQVYINIPLGPGGKVQSQG
jgi:hypothetical protein